MFTVLTTRNRHSVIKHYNVEVIHTKIGPLLWRYATVGRTGTFIYGKASAEYYKFLTAGNISYLFFNSTTITFLYFLIRRREAFQFYLLSRGKHQHLIKAMTTVQNTVVPHSSGQYVGRGGSDYRSPEMSGLEGWSGLEGLSGLRGCSRLQGWSGLEGWCGLRGVFRITGVVRITGMVRTIEGKLLEISNIQKSSLSVEAILLKAEIMYLTM